MAGRVNPIPDGHHSVTPYLIVNGAADAIAFYKRAFAAREVMRMPAPDGRIGHAEIRIGDSPVMLADEYPEVNTRSPRSIGGTSVHIYLYVADVDTVAKAAVDAGATVLRPVQDQFYGDRSGAITDPYGHIWHVATHKEDVPPDELRRRADAAMRQMGERKSR